MARFVNMILRQLVKSGVNKISADGGPMTADQKAAQKRVRKAMRAASRMNRI